MATSRLRTADTRRPHLKTETVIAANRFGLGARPGDLESIDRDPRSWLLDQLQGPSRQPSDFRNLPQTPELIVEAQYIQRMQHRTRQRDDQPAPDIVQKFGAYVRRNYIDQIKARYRVATRSDFPFYERLVHFWSNHFAVSADKPPIPAIAGLYEIEAIRPNIAGNFADLLIAAEQHNVMSFLNRHLLLLLELRPATAYVNFSSKKPNHGI